MIALKEDMVGMDITHRVMVYNLQSCLALFAGTRTCLVGAHFTTGTTINGVGKIVERINQWTNGSPVWVGIVTKMSEWAKNTKTGLATRQPLADFFKMSLGYCEGQVTFVDAVWAPQTYDIQCTLGGPLKTDGYQKAWKLGYRSTPNPNPTTQDKTDQVFILKENFNGSANGCDLIPAMGALVTATHLIPTNIGGFSSLPSQE